MFQAVKKLKRTDHFLNIVKQTSFPLLLPLWHFFLNKSVKGLYFSAVLHFHLSTITFLSFLLLFSCTVWFGGAELCQALLAYCSSKRGRMSAHQESVPWRQREETPSLMAGNSNLLSRRREDISFCIFSAGVQEHYHRWHSRELKFNQCDL